GSINNVIRQREIGQRWRHPVCQEELVRSVNARHGGMPDVAALDGGVHQAPKTNTPCEYLRLHGVPVQKSAGSALCGIGRINGCSGKAGWKVAIEIDGDDFLVDG